LKALLAHPACEREIDRDALAGYLRFGYFASTGSVLQGIRQLRPGTALEIPSDGREPIEHVYWQACEAAARPSFNANNGDLTDELDHLLTDAVRRRMVADVPLGAFLSGGVDSSTVVAMMQHHSPRPVKTFSIGFNEPRYNEAPYAKAIAQHLGTDHTEFYVAPEAALELIPRLTEWFDEPFADASQIPTRRAATFGAPPAGGAADGTDDRRVGLAGAPRACVSATGTAGRPGAQTGGLDAAAEYRSHLSRNPQLLVEPAGGGSWRDRIGRSAVDRNGRRCRPRFRRSHGADRFVDLSAG
jgi:hypothetical protein